MPGGVQREGLGRGRPSGVNPSRPPDGRGHSILVSKIENRRYPSSLYMGHRLSELVRSHHLDPKAWAPVPVLLWREAPPPREKPELLWVTQGNHRLEGPPAADPEIFRVEKVFSEDKVNAFALGITLGRTVNNDMMIDDTSVSRFHAFFQQDPQSGVWHVMDAASSNGTFVGGVRLAPRKPAPVSDGSALQFGHVKMEFLSAQGFMRLLEQKLRPGAGPDTRSRGRR